MSAPPSASRRRAGSTIEKILQALTWQPQAWKGTMALAGVIVANQRLLAADVPAGHSSTLLHGGRKALQLAAF